MTPQTFEKSISLLQQFYTWVDSLQVSPGFLFGMAVLFVIAGVLALREAGSWFFKIEDVKSDISQLRDSMLQLESEIRLVQTLLRETNENSVARNPATDLTTADENLPAPSANLDHAPVKSEEKPIQFPIHH